MSDFNQEPQDWFAENAPQPTSTGPTPNPASQPAADYDWFAANAPPSARKPAGVTSWQQDLENHLWGSGGPAVTSQPPVQGQGRGTSSSSTAPASTGSGTRPQTADFLRDLAGIGTPTYLHMRASPPPGYQQWRDHNFTPDGSGNFVSQAGQPYTQSELRQMHGLLSQQAGNPLISALFRGPKSSIADYMVWRNQNFVGNQGTYQDEDGALYSEPELEKMFAAKSQARPEVQNPTGAGANQGSANRPRPQLVAQNAPAPQVQPSPGPAGAAARNPLGIADPARELADFLRWRNQNFRATQDGRWEGSGARVYTNEEVRGLYAAQREAQAQRQPTPQDNSRLTAREQQEAGAVAYSEDTVGTVAEHEAIVSVLLNRARSGDRQYVNHGQDVNVHNVIHATAPGGLQQFQGVEGNNYREFVRGTAADQGAQNAREAATNIGQAGPTNQATSFIVTTGRDPTRAEVAGLGQHMQQVGRAGNVFLYAPAPPAQNRPGPRGNPQPQRRQPQPRGPGAGTAPPLQPQPND